MTTLAAARTLADVGEPLRVDDVRGRVTASPLDDWMAWVALRDGVLGPRPVLPGPGKGDPFGLASVDDLFPHALPSGERLPDEARLQLIAACQAHVHLQSAGRTRGFASRSAATAAVVENAAGDHLMTELCGTLAPLVRKAAFEALEKAFSSTSEDLLSAAWLGFHEAVLSFDPDRGDPVQHVTSVVQRSVEAQVRNDRLPGVKPSLVKHAYAVLGLMSDIDTDDAQQAAGRKVAELEAQAEKTLSKRFPELTKDEIRTLARQYASRNSGSARIRGDVPAIVDALRHGNASVEELLEAEGGWQAADPEAVDPADLVGSTPTAAFIAMITAGVPDDSVDLVLGRLMGDTAEVAEHASAGPATLSAAAVRAAVENARALAAAPHAQYCFLAGIPVVTVAPAAPRLAPSAAVWGDTTS